MLATIAELEEQVATETPLSPQGRWSLLFSTQVALPDSAAERPSSMAIVQPLIDATYGLFFKVAPQLAGAQQYGGTSLGSNEQIVSIEGASGKVENRVRVPLPRWMGSAPSRLEIRLFGDVSTTEAEDTLSVTFTECIFQVGGGDDPRPRARARAAAAAGRHAANDVLRRRLAHLPRRARRRLCAEAAQAGANHRASRRRRARIEISPPGPLPPPPPPPPRLAPLDRSARPIQSPGRWSRRRGPRRPPRGGGGRVDRRAVRVGRCGVGAAAAERVDAAVPRRLQAVCRGAGRGRL